MNTEDLPDCTDTGNFACALANLLSVVSKCSPEENPILQKLRNLPNNENAEGEKSGNGEKVKGKKSKKKKKKKAGKESENKENIINLDENQRPSSSTQNEQKEAGIVSQGKGTREGQSQNAETKSQTMTQEAQFETESKTMTQQIQQAETESKTMTQQSQKIETDSKTEQVEAESQLMTRQTGQVETDSKTMTQHSQKVELDSKTMRQQVERESETVTQHVEVVPNIQTHEIASKESKEKKEDENKLNHETSLTSQEKELKFDQSSIPTSLTEDQETPPTHQNQNTTTSSPQAEENVQSLENQATTTQQIGEQSATSQEKPKLSAQARDQSGSSPSSDNNDDEEWESTEGLAAFTRLNLEDMLKKAATRVNLRKLFKPGQFEALCTFQKRRVVRLENKCTLLLELGLPLPSEDILREKMGLRRLNRPDPESSGSDSDEDWGPSGSKRKTKKLPMFRGISEGDTKLRQEFIRKYVEDRQTGKPIETPPPPKKGAVKRTANRRVSEKKEKPKFERFNESSSGEASSRYDTRPNAGVKYTEAYVPEDDHFVFCDECQTLHVDDCPDHPAMRMKDTLVKIGVKNRAKLTCPPGLSVDPSQIRNGGLGVWSEIDIPKNTVFGPYEGEIVKIYDVKNLVKVSEGGYSWEIYKKDKLSHYIDGSDNKTSNWLRYVNCARSEEEQNLIAFQYKGQIYYRTFKQVKTDVELFVWYGSHYASQMGIGFKTLKDKTFKPRPIRAINNKPTSRTICNIIASKDIHSSNILSDSSDYQDSSMPEPRIDSQQQKNDFETLKTSDKVQCPQCMKVIVSSYLRCHIKTIHDKVKDFKCTICGKAFTQSTSLKNHMPMHTGEKPFKCDICGGRFALSINFQRHRRIHTGEKPYKCDICGERFAHSNTLKAHRRIHTGEKPHKCDICGERFTQRGNLQAHRRIHTGEKPYKCDVCGERFAQQGSLQGHRRIHTGEKPYKCDICEKRFARSSNLRDHHQRTHK